MDPPKMIPPDGGWGWIIVCAYGLNNIIVIPVVQSFGLIFQDTFSRLNMSATDTSIIINVNSAFGMALGLVNGPLLKKFGYRKVSLAGACFITFGIILTAYADSFTHFLITYGIITSLGFGLVISAFSLALNSYFEKKRNKASGLAMTITGLGPIFFPPMITVLLSVYGVQGCVLIIGGLAGHSIVAAMLLQPVAWHMKRAPPVDIPLAVIEEKDEDEDELEVEKSSGFMSEDEDDYLDRRYKKRSSLTASSIDHDIDVQSIYGFDSTPQIRPEHKIELPKPIVLQKIQTVNRMKFIRSISHAEPRSQFPMRRPDRGLNSGSLEGLNSEVPSNEHKITHCLPEEDEEMDDVSIIDDTNSPIIPRSIENIQNISPVVNIQPGEQEEPKILLKSALKKVSKFPSLEKVDPPDLKKEEELKVSFKHRMIDLFDLDLLTDPVYVSMMVGMSIAIFAEINFSLLTPFILNDMGYTMNEIATIMSALAVTDIMARFISPFLGDYLKQGPRHMYIYSLAMLIVMRSSLIYADTFPKMIAVGLVLGAAKGVRIVYMSLVIPSYICIEKLASASGIQMVVNGIFLLIFGPMLGVIRDQTGSYTKCIIFINAVTLFTIILWTVEKFITAHRIKKRDKFLKLIS